MKSIALIIIVLLSFSPVFGQSFLKASINKSRLYSCLFCQREGSKFAFALGHQIYLLKKDDVKVIFGDGIDYKRLHYRYYKGGKGAGTSYKGDLDQFNVELDLRLRKGKNLFGEIGVFTSYSFLKKSSNQKSIFYQTCFLPPTGGVCPPITYPTSPFQDNLKPFDYGLLLGMGYQLKKITLELDYQLGIPIILKNSSYSTDSAMDQFNLSCSIPFSVLKKKKQ